MGDVCAYMALSWTTTSSIDSHGTCVVMYALSWLFRGAFMDFHGGARCISLVDFHVVLPRCLHDAFVDFNGDSTVPQRFFRGLP